MTEQVIFQSRECLSDSLSVRLSEACSRLSLDLTDVALKQLSDYFQLMREWNNKINLTAVLDDEGMAIRHLLDSLTLLPFLDRCTVHADAGSISLIDVGTGAGLPGIPLKIIRPNLDVMLLDALAKRIRFLDAVIGTLGLSGIGTRHARAEDAARAADMREQFDIATARAVASLPTLCEYCLPFVRPGGAFLAMKGQAGEDWHTADKAIRILGGELADISEFMLPGTDMKRSILTIRKISATPKPYPRKAGKPEQQPL